MGKGVNIPLTISGLKQAKEDLAKLNDELESLDKESDDYIKKSKQLSKAWNEQSEAIDKTTEELIELNKAGKLVGTKFDDLNETLFNAKEEVLPLTSAIGEMEDRLYALAKSGDTSSAEFKALQSEIVKNRKVIIETDRAIDGMVDNAGSIGGITTAFGELGESVVNLDFKRAGVALKGLGTQFKAFGATLLANPIFLIVAVIAAVVTAVVTLKDKVAFLGAIFDFFADIVNTAIQALKDFLDWIGLTNFAEQDLAAKRAEQAKEYLENLNEQSNAYQSDIDRKIALAQAEGKNVVELEKQKQREIAKTNFERQKAILFLFKQEQITGELTKERAKELQKLFNEANETRKNALNQLKVIEATSNKEAREKAKERKAEKDKELAEDKQRELDYLKFKEEAENARLDKIAEIDELIYQASLSDQEREISAIREQYFTQIELAKQFGLDSSVLEEEQQEKIAAIEDKYRKEKEAKDKEAADKEKQAKKEELELAQATEEAKLDFVTSGLNLASQITDLFGKKNEKAAKRAFAIQKAVSIAQAVIDTYKGANAIFASAAANPASVLFPAQPFIAAGLAIAGGIANVAKIAQTKFEGGSAGGGGGGFSAPSLGGGGGSSSSASTPSFELFGDANQGNNASSPESVETNQQMTVKAVVVESDITNTQGKVEKMKKNAEL